jgi:ABC-type amino acid transport substrate-binding protein
MGTRHGRWWQGLAAVACVLVCLCSQAAAPPDPLDIYVEDAADPFSKADGTGYANDLVLAAFAAMGISVNLKVVPYARCKQLVLAAKVPVCVSMSWDPSFEGHIKFADHPLILITPVYFENPARPLKARNETQLGAGLTIGVVRGYEYPDSAMQVQARGAVFDPNRDERASLKKLAAGRIDAAMVMSNELTGVYHWVDDAGVRGQVRMAFSSAMRELGYLGVSTSHPLGLWALEQFNQGYKIILGNGTAQQLKLKWKTPPGLPPVEFGAAQLSEGDRRLRAGGLPLRR